MSEHVIRWLSVRAAYEELRVELERLRERVAEPGACERTARFLLTTLGALPSVADYQHPKKQSA
jgi:hypothetical protein